MKYVSFLLFLMFSNAGFADNGNKIPVLVKSNVLSEYYLDGELLGKGRSYYIDIFPSESYELIVSPEGYYSKEHFLEPPYMSGITIDFFFLIEDKKD